MFYNDCPVDPAHPCRHPIFDTTKFVTERYDPATLTPEQSAWEAKRAARRSRARAPPPPPISDDNNSDYEDIEDPEDKSTKKKTKKQRWRDLFNYKPKLLPSMADHDFDGIFEECTECGSKLWGTKTIFPLSQSIHYITNPFLEAPVCVACKMLFSSVCIKKNKNDIIIWMLTGEFEGKKTKFPKGYFRKRFRATKGSMRNRSERMRRSKEERIAREAYNKRATKMQLQKEVKKHVSKSKDKMSQKRIRQIEASIHQRFHHARNRLKDEFQKEEVEVASAEELSDLVDNRRYCDGLLGWTLEMINREKFNSLTFDHIEPVTHVKHNNGSFGIGNIQPLCKVLNNIKGSYSEKELCRWLILFLKACHRKYAPIKR